MGKGRRQPLEFSLLKMCAAKAWLVVFAVVLASGPVWSQALISLGGNVTDPNGAAISNATVHLINPASNSDRTTTTDQRGSYTFSDVAPGTYRLLVQAQGFEEYQQADIQVAAGTPTSLNVKLTVKQVQQSVTVRSQEGNECLATQGRVLPDVGPGLRAIRPGPSGNYYVLTAPGTSVAIYSPDGKRIGQVPKPAAPAAASSPSPVSSIINGTDLQVDSTGRVYVADFAANAIKIYSADGILAKTIRVQAPTSVEPLPGGEVAIASMASKHLVDVYDEERGELVRSIGDPEPLVAVCDASTLVCTEKVPVKDPNPAANRLWFYGDSAGNLYIRLINPPNPTIRKYDPYGYLAYESSFPLRALNSPASGSGNAWSINPDVRVASLGTVDLMGNAPQTNTTSSSSTSSNGTAGTDSQLPPGMGGMGGRGMGAGGEGGMRGMEGAGGGVRGGGGADSVRFGVRLNQRVEGPLGSMKPIIDAMGADAASQEVWASIGGVLVHFDDGGKLSGYYCLAGAGQATVKPATILVEPNRILIGSDPFGVFQYPRPDKPSSNGTVSH